MDQPTEGQPTGADTANADVPFDSNRWAWLAGTYWYVPTVTLPALQVINGDTVQTQMVQDQTVWFIERYEAGYVVGQCATSLNSGAFSYKTIAGSVTPLGDVAFSFSTVDAADNGNGTAAPTFGNGRMVEYQGRWAFLMQMTAGGSATNLSHWSYMVRTEPGDPSWTSLPGMPETGVTDVFPS